VQAAAETYFNKPVQNLTVGEAALLAGLLKAPSRYAPTRTNPPASPVRAPQPSPRKGAAAARAIAWLRPLSYPTRRADCYRRSAATL